ncbi:MAG TPA: hypothetical protein VE152_07015, partial [Acidimicrobiales bacterium]|nr:hypothetical protein [Acidimicrobiales bacterium]
MLPRPVPSWFYPIARGATAATPPARGGSVDWERGERPSEGVAVADLVQQAHVHELLDHGDGPCVSVFLPTHRTAPDSDQDPIRLKNLLEEAEERLVAGGLRAPDARSLLAPGRRLLGLERFWTYQSDGLALFLAPGWFRSFRLPLALSELVVVGGRFHVKPLLGLLVADGRFYVLALSRHQVRLLEGSRQRVEEVDLAHVPHNLAEALAYDDLEKRRTFHVAGRGSVGGPAVFHGHGVGAETDKALLKRFLHEVDQGVAEVLGDRGAPLVLAGVGYERAMFAEVSRYPGLLAQGIEGNPDELRPEELHRRAWAIVAPV